ncbi:proton extrusion protein PcxA [Scytonema hofmannii PCC 7110]|uniref:Proton extrusion protein PxcA n=1 Tax=Scytonema hofmannii PCC 7110 TaxID=128403 RepID=A0A139X8T4_9CYAN|nr:proton extrusion protein PcxA [Scytonema hofmannii]KYC41121.1 proton extrusion protein PcxA [Scytonema hofmannii PCC 7110]
MKDSFVKDKKIVSRDKLKKYLQSIYQWFTGTPERSLSEAYQAAQTIRNIEIEYFAGRKISPESATYSESAISYWQVQLERNLIIIKLRLTEFKIGNSLFNTSNSTFLEKLQFIDEILDKYNYKQEKPEQVSDESIVLKPQNSQINNVIENPINSSHDIEIRDESAFNKSGLLPRTIGRTFSRIQADFSSEAEETFVRNFRFSQNRTRMAVRFFLLLIIIPMLTQHFSKPLIEPIVARVRGENPNQIFLHHELEEEAFKELKTFEKKLQFQHFISQAPPISPESIEHQVKEKARELLKEFQAKSNSAISNVFADLLSLIAFALVIVTSQKEILVVKAFLDNIIYGLSDSAKAFLIILFTDTFVGFHSPHGWEVILDGLAEHIGLPANQSLISLFIATFPVILDTIFKYWIFRYLSRLSPSALATYKDMNE